MLYTKTRSSLYFHFLVCTLHLQHPPFQFLEQTKAKTVDFSNLVLEAFPTLQKLTTNIMFHFRIAFPASYIFLQFFYWTYYFYLAKDQV